MSASIRFTAGMGLALDFSSFVLIWVKHLKLNLQLKFFPQLRSPRVVDLFKKPAGSYTT